MKSSDKTFAELTLAERKLISALLKEASEYFGNRSCNDFDVSFLSPEERNAIALGAQIMNIQDRGSAIKEMNEIIKEYQEGTISTKKILETFEELMQDAKRDQSLVRRLTNICRN